MGEIYKKPATVRKAAQRGKEITVPPEAELQPGDEVIQFFDGFLLTVPKGTKVDENLLKKAIKPEVKKAEEDAGT